MFPPVNRYVKENVLIVVWFVYKLVGFERKTELCRGAATCSPITTQAPDLGEVK